MALFSSYANACALVRLTYYSKRSGFKVEPEAVQVFEVDGSRSTVQRFNVRRRIDVFIPGILPWPICSSFSVVER